MDCPLHERALNCVKNFKKSERELLDVLEEMDKTKIYLTLGVSSLFRYCVEKLGLSESETYRLTQVTRKSQQVPALKAAIVAGDLTISKASRIAPILTNGNSADWIEKAKTLTQREIERELSKQNPAALPKARIKPLGAEMNELRICLSNETERALARLQEVLRTKTIEETVAAAIRFTLRQKDPLLKAKRAAVFREPAGRVMSRSIPVGLKHQVSLRDQGRCGFRGCNETRWVEIHHLRPLSMGGSHAPSNLLTLCSAHHRMMHAKLLKKTAKGRSVWRR